MTTMWICYALFGQVDNVVPPAPAPAVTTLNPIQLETIEDQRAWLLGRMMVDISLDAKTSADVGRLLNQMDADQMRELIAAYKGRVAQGPTVPKSQVQAAQQQALDQAQLSLRQAETYRNQLQRRADLNALQAPLMQNLLIQNMINNQQVMAMYGVGGYIYGRIGMGYGPAAYGSIGYGPVGYAQYGYGVPGYGAPVIYGGPYFTRGRRMGYW